MAASKQLGRWWGVVAASAASVAIATTGCSGVGPGDEAAVGEGEVGSELSFHAEASPLSGFSYDTGMMPASGPARAQLKLAAGGALKVDAAAIPREDGLAGKKGGGKLALDVQVTMTGRLVVDTSVAKYDGEIPGLANVKIPITGASPFDGLLLGTNESAEARADVPETTLPEIPLGSVPGALVLTVAKGTTLTSKFHGTCASVAGGKATYAGESKTGGVLVLRSKIVLKLPAPFAKTIDLPEVKVDIPAVPTALTGSAAAAGLADSKAGACSTTTTKGEEPARDGGAGSSGGSSSGGSSSGGSSSGGSSSGGSSSGGSSSGGVVGSKFTVKVDGAAGVPGAIDVTTEPMPSGMVMRKAHLYFTAPGLTGATRVIVSATSTGSGCSSLIGLPLQGVEYQAYEAGIYRVFRSSPATGPCGLTVDEAGTRLKGTFIGSMPSADGTPGSRTMTLTFDVAVP